VKTVNDERGYVDYFAKTDNDERKLLRVSWDRSSAPPRLS